MAQARTKYSTEVNNMEKEMVENFVSEGEFFVDPLTNKQMYGYSKNMSKLSSPKNKKKMDNNPYDSTFDKHNDSMEFMTNAHDSLYN